MLEALGRFAGAAGRAPLALAVRTLGPSQGRRPHGRRTPFSRVHLNGVAVSL